MKTQKITKNLSTLALNGASIAFVWNRQRKKGQQHTGTPG